MTTIPFGPRQEDPVIAKAAELPREIAPARDLWPGIAARLGEEGRRAPTPVFGWPSALAAGFLVAAVSALLTWGLLREPDRIANAPIAAETAVLPVSYGPNSALGEEQLAARDALLVEFRTRFARLSPATRDAVLTNLAVIQQAADEIDAALAADPASGLLNELLVGTYQQELQLYSKVVTASGGTTRRS